MSDEAMGWMRRLDAELGETDAERDNRAFAPLVAAFNALFCQMGGNVRFDRFTECAEPFRAARHVTELPR
jgi:hypothetical protein